MLRDDLATTLRCWVGGLPYRADGAAVAVLALLRERGIVPVPILDLVKSLKEGEEPR